MCKLREGEITWANSLACVSGVPHVRTTLGLASRVPGSGYEDHERWNHASFTTGHPKPRGPDPVSDLSPDIEVPGGHLNCSWGSEEEREFTEGCRAVIPSPVTSL